VCFEFADIVLHTIVDIVLHTIADIVLHTIADVVLHNIVDVDTIVVTTPTETGDPSSVTGHCTGISGEQNDFTKIFVLYSGSAIPVIIISTLRIQQVTAP
jgi:hypothetical protein